MAAYRSTRSNVKFYIQNELRFGWADLMYYFAADSMKQNQPTYRIIHVISSVFMILSLVWLTVSAPFVFQSQQQLVKQHIVDDTSNPLGSPEEEANPFSNTTEEKKPSGGNSFSEEYLHDQHHNDYFTSLISRSHKSENAGTYTAFHGEVQVPPPNIA